MLIPYIYNNVVSAQGACFQETVIALRGDDDVVEELDVNCPAGLYKAVREVLVLLAGRERSAGMVVAEHHGGALTHDGLTQHLPDIHHRGGQSAPLTRTVLMKVRLLRKSIR